MAALQPPSEPSGGDAVLAEHVAENRRHWDSMADQWVAAGERAWASDEPTWGMWEIPESELRLLPEELDGTVAVELGCGTAYWSAWLTRRGARAVGIDNSSRQLETAHRLAAQHGTDITLLHGNAESVPYPDASFDLAFSEYGAAIWCDPERWIPEAHRLLRPGGTLIFLGNHPLAMVCQPLDGSGPATDRLERPYFGLGRLDWRDATEDPGGIEFNLPISEWVALFRRTGFDIVDYREIQAPEPSAEVRYFASAEWSHHYPSEQVWKLRKR
jgi:SAM-dependent methyltransferase